MGFSLMKILSKMQYVTLTKQQTQQFASANKPLEVIFIVIYIYNYIW